MTICIATSNFPPQTGGIATFGNHLAAGLAQLGHRVIVLTPGDTTGGQMNDSISTNGNITVIHLREQFSDLYALYKNYFPPGSLDAPYWIAAGLAMRNWLLQNAGAYQVDIIEAGDYGGTGIFLCDQQLPPVVLTGHGSFTQLSRFNAVNPDTHTAAITRFEQLSCREADGSIVHSRQNQQELQTRCRNQVYLAAAPWQMVKGNEAKEVEDLIVIAGGLQKVKGAIVVAEAVQQLQDAGSPVVVQWAGGDSYTAPGGRSMCAYLQNRFPEIWQTKFRWLNELTAGEALDLVSRAALVIIPSEWEAFGYTALEAASLGKAILITETTGAASLFTHGKDAWIIPAGDAAKLAGAIQHLLQDAPLRHSLGSRAAETVRSRYPQHAYAEQRTTVYESVIAARKKRTAFPADPQIMLKTYRKPSRKFFYQLKKQVKKIIRRNK